MGDCYFVASCIGVDADNNIFFFFCLKNSKDGAQRKAVVRTVLTLQKSMVVLWSCYPMIPCSRTNRTTQVYYSVSVVSLSHNCEVIPKTSIFVLQKHPTHPAFLSQGWLTPYVLKTNDSNSGEYNGHSLNKQTFHRKVLYLALSGFLHYYGSLP